MTNTKQIKKKIKRYHMTLAEFYRVSYRNIAVKNPYSGFIMSPELYDKKNKEVENKK